MPEQSRSFPRTLARGIAAGVAATTTMSAFMALAKATGALGEPPPKKITRHVIERTAPQVARHPLMLDLASWVDHFGFGAAMGALYAAVSRKRGSTVPRALVFGTLVWLTSYAGVVPALGIMRTPDRDRPGRPSAMLAAHWVFGAALHHRLGGNG